MFHLTGLIITLSTTFNRILNTSHINNVFCIVNVFLQIEVSRVLARQKNKLRSFKRST